MPSINQVDLRNRALEFIGSEGLLATVTWDNAVILQDIDAGMTLVVVRCTSRAQAIEKARAFVRNPHAKP